MDPRSLCRRSALWCGVGREAGRGRKLTTAFFSAGQTARYPPPRQAQGRRAHRCHRYVLPSPNPKRGAPGGARSLTPPGHTQPSSVATPPKAIRRKTSPFRRIAILSFAAPTIVIPANRRRTRESWRETRGGWLSSFDGTGTGTAQQPSRFGAGSEHKETRGCSRSGVFARGGDPRVTCGGGDDDGCSSQRHSSLNPALVRSEEVPGFACTDQPAALTDLLGSRTHESNNRPCRTTSSKC